MKPLSRRVYALSALALAIVIFVCVNIAANLFITTSRIDLTENGQFTLADGTRNIVAKIPETITLKFYFSKATAAQFASVQAYATRVHDLLQEYAALSHGKIVLQEIDPEPFSAAEDEATANGLTGAQTDTGESVYFGLVATNSIDGKETIPYFNADREPYLELDISTLLYDLSQPHKNVLGVLSSLPLEGGGLQAELSGASQPNVIYAALSQTYDTRALDPSANMIPPDVSVLMVVHPNNLSAAALYAIDQFVLRGGRALIFVDPSSQMAQAGGGMDPRGGGQPTSDLPQLFRAWGVGYAPDKVVADRTLARQVQISNDPVSPVIAYPVWLHLTKDQFDPKDIVTASMQSMNLATAGALFPLKGATTSFTALIHSSDDAALLDAESVNYVRPQDLLGAVHPTGESLTIAARVSGPARTAFPAGPPAPLTTAGQAPPPLLPPQIKQSNGPINVIVMADTDLFQDRFWVHVETAFGKQVAAPIADNGAFVLNAVENLMGSSDLISLRTRASNDRPFTVVQDMQARAQADLQQRAEALQASLTRDKQRLHDLEQTGGASGQPGQAAGLTPAQQGEIDHVKRELIDTRTQLRDVQHRLRKDVDALGDVLAFVNIALVPILVAGFAILLAVLRRRRRARALAA